MKVLLSFFTLYLRKVVQLNQGFFFGKLLILSFRFLYIVHEKY